jgi:hypothetical protein
MWIRQIVLLFVSVSLGLSADQPVWRSVTLPDVEFDFRLVQNVDEIQRLAGERLDDEFTFVEVRLRALYGTEVALDRSSFTLRSFKGNERSNAQSPDRIAGNGSLMVRPGTVGGAGVYTQGREQVPLGRGPGGGAPRRSTGVPSGIGGPVLGGGQPRDAERSLEVPAESAEADRSLHGRLTRLELPLDAGDRDVSGYLYFQIDPKHKLKHISLSYDGRYGEFRVEFKN